MSDAIALVESSTLQEGLCRNALNRSDLTLLGRAAELDIPMFVSLARGGHDVEITLRKGGWIATLRSQGTAAFEIAQDPPDVAFTDSATIAGLTEAEAARDVTRYVGLCTELEAEVNVSLVNRPSTAGFHWYRTIDALKEDLKSAGWLELLIALCAQQGNRRVIVHDARASWIDAPGLVVHGPEVLRDAPAVIVRPNVEQYRTARLSDECVEAPTPLDFAPNKSKGLDGIAKLLNGAAEQLTWLWMARKVTVDASGVNVRFDGARVIEGSLTIYPTDSATDALALWDWATQTTDPVRSETLLRTISLAVDTPNELMGAGRAILVSATSVLEVALRSRVAEAVAARGAARDAAMSASRAAADDARAAAAKSFDRVVVQAAAVAGLLLANEKDAIEPAVTRGLLLLVATLLLTLAVIVLVVDFPSARASLAAFKVDLKQYRDILTEGDVHELREMESLRKASRTICKAQALTCVVLVAGLVAVYVAYAKVN